MVHDKAGRNVAEPNAVYHQRQLQSTFQHHTSYSRIYQVQWNSSLCSESIGVIGMFIEHI